MDREPNAMDFIESINIDNITLTDADESAIFLEALQDACTDQEFKTVMENMTELELYGLIANKNIDAIATEAKKIVIKQTKQMNLNREQAKAAFRLAKNANAQCWKKYKKHRTAMIAAREEIFTKFGTKSKVEAKRVIQNARKKASAMSGNTVTGKTISDKMDAKLKEYSKK